MADNPFSPRPLGSTVSARSDIQTRHASYGDAAQQWQRCSDALSGTDAIKGNARAYVPRTKDHVKHPASYDEMIARSSYTNFPSRTVDGLEGLIFRRDPLITVPRRFEPRLEAIDNSGDNINTFSKKLVREVLSFGRIAVLVDVLPEAEQVFEKPNSLLPYLVMIQTQAITNWRVKTVDGQQQLDQVIVQEFYDSPDVFGSIQRNRYKVLDLDSNGHYRVRIFEQRDNGEYYPDFEKIPLMASPNGLVPLKSIPLVFISPIDLSPNIRRSPILDLVDSTLDHYRLSTYYYEALFLTANPTPVITGWPDGVPSNLQLGMSNALLLPDRAKAEMLEFHGDGLGSLERAIIAKEAQIAELGARLVQSSDGAAETASAVRIRQHSQTSVVSSIARTASDGLKSALQIACQWAIADGDVQVELNQDYIDSTLAPQTIQQIVSLHNSGLMTKRDVIWNLIQGELVEPNGRSPEEIEHELEREKPILMGVRDLSIAPPKANGATPQGRRQRRRGDEQQPQEE
jgi:hypothetical protein